MRFRHFFKSIFIVFLVFTQSSLAQEINPTRPAMLQDDNYTEYWEQHFYLDDGTLITSQFLAANFPWPVGKDHGIMLGSLVTPEGKLYVIKNGRDLGEWGFDQNALDMFIHTHRLKGGTNGYSVHLENTMGIVDLELKSNQAPFKHKKYESDDGFIQTSFYAPSLTGKGNWQLGPEAGFKPSGPVHNIGAANGFGVHVLMTDKVDKLMRNWTRVIGIGDSAIKPFLSAITRPDDTKDISFRLFDGNNLMDNFSNVKIENKNITKEKDASYPKVIEISASSEKGSISGTIKYSKKLAHFNLTEHLNFFEKSFARSNPVVANFRYLVDYDLVYKTSEGEQKLTGKAFSEYTDIAPAKKAPAKKRRRSRR